MQNLNFADFKIKTLTVKRYIFEYIEEIVVAFDC